MIEINPISSGSSGNAYWIDINDVSILLECGLPIKKIKQWCLNNDKSFRLLSGCFVSHAHKDHSYCSQSIIDNGIKLYASKQTIAECGLRWATEMKDYQTKRHYVKLDGMNVYAMPIEHDSEGTYAFIFDTVDERLYYISDTSYNPYNIKGITHLMIECNHDRILIEKMVADGQIEPQFAGRVIKNHMSLDVVEKTIKQMDKSKLKEIWLLHLSNTRINEKEARERLYQSVNVPIYIA